MTDNTSIEAQMTDRELLERAAQAAGYKVRWHHIWECFVHDQPNIISGKDRHIWVPLEDDGDTLRLAVKLDISIRQKFAMVIAEYPWVDEEFNNRKVLCEGVLDDRYAATRRAVVRAAVATADNQGGV
jgi:hypothetical protein